MVRKDNPDRSELPRRERQVMDIVYARGPVSVADVQAELPDQPTYSATRMLLQRLHKKGLLNHQVDGPKYIYSPVRPKLRASRDAWQGLVQTFFGGSSVAAFSALLGDSSEELTEAELAELEALVAEAKRQRK